MIDPDVVYAKAANIHNCLRRIRQVTKLDPLQLKDIDVQDIFVLNLQRAVQAAIDLAAHIVAAEDLGLPASLRENFSLLEQAGILTEELGGRLVNMVGFRNIAIHDYQNLDVAILGSILSNHLPDLEKFTTTILEHYHL